MTENPLVSVIVPIYKVENYLRECVDSIISQSYSNLEIILVDDGSPDRCPEICDEYALKDSRIKVIHKPNGGLSDARNAGIEVAKGEYLSFVDSDDVIHSQMIEVLMKSILEDNADVSCCDFFSFYDTGELSSSFIRNIQYLVLDPKEWFLRKYSAAAWNKIYRKDLWVSIRFPKGKYHEDVFTTYKICNVANKIAHCGHKLYFYRQRYSSIMKSSNLQRLLDLKEGTSELLNFFFSQDRHLYSYFCIFYAKIFCEMQNPQNRQLYTADTNGFYSLWKKEFDKFPKNDFALKYKIQYNFLVNCTSIRNLFMNIIRLAYRLVFKKK